MGPVFGGFMTESFGFKKASTSMGVSAFVMVKASTEYLLASSKLILCLFCFLLGNYLQYNVHIL